jgi:quinoprotein glucose dehydrogenase
MLRRSLALVFAVTLAGQVSASDGGWTYYGGDQGGRHYSSATQINTQNVSQLELAWLHTSGDVKRYGEAMRNTSTQATPILLPAVAGESLVYCTPFNRVIALDPGSGEQRWQFDPAIDQRGTRTFRCRGVSYAEESRVAADGACRHRLYVATHDRKLWAIDAKNGKPCQSFGRDGSIALFGEEGYVPGDISSSSAPTVAGGLVIVGSGIIDFARATTPRGIVRAFDALSGELAWQFDPLLNHRSSGSANVWAPMSVDEDNGLLYLPTSAPSPDYYGVDRPGGNLYANSIVALELKTGKLRWHFQHVHHDLWDYDTPAQPVLFDWKKGGTSIPALVQVTKQSYVFVFNRLTGEPLWEITDQPVPPSQIYGEQASRIQPKPIAPPPLIDSFLTAGGVWGLTPWDKGRCAKQVAALNNLGTFTPVSERLTLMYPGSLGGANWGGGALLPDTGVLLVNINNAAFTGRLISSATIPASQARSDHPENGQRMQVTMKGTPYTVDIGALLSPLGIPCNPPPWGKLVAVNLYKGTIDWEVALGSVHEMGPITAPFHINWGTPNLGGGAATAGGVFFIGATMDRQIRAFDVANGKTLWKHTLANDATATPMTYTYRGKQFVVISAGGHAMFQRGYGDHLYAFALPAVEEK